MTPEASGWLVLLLVVLLALGWYLSYSAARLDRLHHRVESARAALDAHLARRAAAAIETAALLDPASGLILAAAGAESLAEGAARAAAGPLPAPVAEDVENDLTRALQDTLADPGEVALLRAVPLAGDVLDTLEQACTRVQLARRFHNDAVAQAQRVRRKRVVRWAHLAGRAAMPRMVEFDDTVPAALGS